MHVCNRMSTLVLVQVYATFIVIHCCAQKGMATHEIYNYSTMNKAVRNTYTTVAGPAALGLVQTGAFGVLRLTAHPHIYRTSQKVNM